MSSISQQSSGDNHSDPVMASGTITSNSRIPQFSWIRVIACFAIVLLHILDNSLSYCDIDPVSTGAVLAKVGTSLLMWAVPCFLMVTGALLLDSGRSLPMRKLFGKYIRRVALALLVFTLIFAVIQHRGDGVSAIISNFLTGLLSCGTMQYLWYLYLMIGLYLMMPLYKTLADNASDRMMWYLVELIVLFVAVMPMTKYFGIENAFYIPTDVIYPAYLFMGYLLYRRNMSAKAALCLLIVCGAAVVILTMKCHNIPDLDTNGLYGYRSPFTYGLSASVYSLMLRIKVPAGEILTGIDKCSFGIYLIHMIGVWFIMKEFGFDPYDYGPFGFAGLAIVLFIASFALTWLLRKIPYVDKVL